MQRRLILRRGLTRSLVQRGVNATRGGGKVTEAGECSPTSGRRFINVNQPQIVDCERNMGAKSEQLTYANI